MNQNYIFSTLTLKFFIFIFTIDEIYGELLKFSVGESPVKRPQLIRQSTAVYESPKKEPKTKKSRIGNFLIL